MEKKLYVVSDYTGWGSSLNVVRASSAEEAKELVLPNFRTNPRANMECEELRDGDGILWCREDSPDSVRERD